MAWSQMAQQKYTSLGYVFLNIWRSSSLSIYYSQMLFSNNIKHTILTFSNVDQQEISKKFNIFDNHICLTAKQSLRNPVTFTFIILNRKISYESENFCTGKFSHYADFRTILLLHCHSDKVMSYTKKMLHNSAAHTTFFWFVFCFYTFLPSLYINTMFKVQFSTCFSLFTVLKC